MSSGSHFFCNESVALKASIEHNNPAKDRRMPLPPEFLNNEFTMIFRVLIENTTKSRIATDFFLNLHNSRVRVRTNREDITTSNDKFGFTAISLPVTNLK